VKTWCIPPKADAEFVFRMEDVLRVYQLPYDQRYPVVCMDEASKQLIGESRVPLPARPGAPRCEDYEYVRNGVCNQFVCCEPLRGWRKVTVTARRTRLDWAECMRELLEVHYPKAKLVRLVLDNLNTHTGSSLYERYPPEVARRLLDRVEFHYTPKHASWLNMAEIEISVLNRQCLNRRIAEESEFRREVAAWEQRRNADAVKIHWSFTIAVARSKLKKLYPTPTN
jgi:hypothetical protein